MARIIRTKAGKVLLFDYMRLPILAYASHFAVFSAIPPRLISGPPTLVKQDVKYFPPQAVRERESALAVAAGRTNLSELARVNSGNEARPGTR